MSPWLFINQVLIKWSTKGFSQLHFHKVDNIASGSSYKTLNFVRNSQFYFLNISFNE